VEDVKFTCIMMGYFVLVVACSYIQKSLTSVSVFYGNWLCRRILNSESFLNNGYVRKWFGLLLGNAATGVINNRISLVVLAQLSQVFLLLHHSFRICHLY
jgi:hypothetical protein